jgi:hypothetical protein
MGDLQKIRILFAEDLPTDVELAVRELKREGLSFLFKVVETEIAFRQELEAFKPDIVISDYSMPAFDGMSALKITRELPYALPFIILTGSMNEETAVACMKAGANDYVIKEQIKRLPFAVKEVLNNWKTQQQKEELESQLRSSLQGYRDLINGMNETVWIISLEGKLLEVNTTAVEVMGYSREELLSLGLEGIDQHLGKEGIRHLVKTMAADKKQSFQTIHTTKSGQQIPVEINSSLVNYRGQTAILSVARNISERKKREEIQHFLYKVSQLTIPASGLKDYLSGIHRLLKEIIYAENFYVALFDDKTRLYTLPYFADQFDDYASDTPVSLQHTLTDFVRKSGEARRITPECERELIQEHHIEIIGEPSAVWMGAPLWDSESREVIGVLVVQHYEDQQAYTDDDLHTLEIIAANIGVFIERMKALEKIRISDVRFQSVLNSTTDLVQVVDRQGKLLFVNKAFLLNFKKTEEDVLGKSIEDLMPPQDAALCTSTNRMALEAGRVVRNEEQLGNQVFETLKFPVDLGYGETGVGAFIRDITDKKRMLLELQDAKERAEESDRLKSAFLANMSHEIRTPMNGILGFTELLAEPEIGQEEREEFIRIIKKSGKRMLNTVNDIIEVSKIETGQVGLNKVKIDLGQELLEVYGFFSPEAEAKGLKLELQIPQGEELCRIETDLTKLNSILNNLIKNAIKFTEEGSIRIGYAWQDEDTLLFFVEDTGIGIPLHRQEAIFERFIQADVGDTRAYQGSGLGLSIAKSYVEMLGGRMKLESAPGKGSRFTFTLPCPGKEKEVSLPLAGKEEAPVGYGKKLKILIADDDEVADMYLSLVLEDMALEVLHAANGEEAVALCKSHPDIDLILMDIKMPLMDGYEATRAIRTFNPEVVIIAQTAYAIAGDREKALEAGCTDYISKPVQANHLLQIISKYPYKPHQE